MDLSEYKFFKNNNHNNDKYYLLQFDGASKGNGNKSAGGSVLFNSDNKIIFTYGQYLSKSTNNQAEYMGLLGGLEKAKTFGIRNLLIEGDSLLIIKQILGEYKVKNFILQKFHSKIIKLLNDHFDSIGIKHIYRNYNKIADGIANDAIKLEDDIFNYY
jgi:ribonuclease HI